MISVNCAAIPESLIDPELHAPGKTGVEHGLVAGMPAPAVCVRKLAEQFISRQAD